MKKVKICLFSKIETKFKQRLGQAPENVEAYLNHVFKAGVSLQFFPVTGVSWAICSLTGEGACSSSRENGCKKVPGNRFPGTVK